MGIVSKVMWCFTIFFGWSENTSGKAVTPEQRPKEGKETNSVCISGKNTLGRGTDNVQALQQSGACVLENHPGTSAVAEGRYVKDEIKEEWKPDHAHIGSLWECDSHSESNGNCWDA